MRLETIGEREGERERTRKSEWGRKRKTERTKKVFCNGKTNVIKTTQTIFIQQVLQLSPAQDLPPEGFRYRYRGTEGFRDMYRGVQLQKIL